MIVLNLLLSFAIKEHNLELIDDIYKECIIRFKEDLGNNNAFLGINNSNIPDYYPEYVLRYSLDTTMIIDSPPYSININSHLHFSIFSNDYMSIALTTHKPTITFMIPYIKFVNYPQNYNRIWEICFPKFSQFIKTINRDIYKTWNGEALINSTGVQKIAKEEHGNINPGYVDEPKRKTCQTKSQVNSSSPKVSNLTTPLSSNSFMQQELRPQTNSFTTL
ncbi:hypothetical protein GLOIN_2v1874127 [Rhizophagus clarus]|uniref:Uncharacterized protein n=1 Tax=Rhizophagus clarus TaxID=94130 RepID=A0A8H3LDB7_9GLOM|nr:hypothetical protein GLOIN_2v1874127 [Rhizophagus clarus]